MTRKPLSPMKRLRIFENALGVCHICIRKIQAGEKWEVEHRIPLALGGADDESNMSPAHKDCHAGKTRADAASWSKAKQMKIKHIDGRRSRTPLSCGRGSKWKRTFYNGTVLR